MHLSELLSEEVTKVPMEALDKEEAIAELVELLVRAGRMSDRQGVLNALYEREAKGTTGIGGGVAIPHARHPSIEGVVLAAGVGAEGIEFDAVDEKLVHVVFLVVAEEHNPGPNIEVLAYIGNLMQIPGAYDRLKEAASAGQFARTIEEIELEL